LCRTKKPGLAAVFVAVHVGFRIEEVFRAQGIFVNAVDGVGGGQAFALGLALGFFRRTGNVEFDREFDFSMQVQGDLVQADSLDRGVQLDLVTADVEAFGSQDFNDVTSSYRTVELAGFASRTDDDEGLAAESVGNGLGFRLALEVTSFERGALGFEALLVGFVGAQRLALRQQEVTSKAVANLDGFAHLAELCDAFEENDLHDPVPFSCQYRSLKGRPFGPA